MKKLTRTKVLIDKIESEIERNQRRIATISAHNFELRKTLEALKAVPTDKPLTKAELDARDKQNRAGKHYDAAYHEEQREAKRLADEAAKKAAEEAAEPVMDSADQEIGMSGGL
jgi:hypothetical protein